MNDSAYIDRQAAEIARARDASAARDAIAQAVAALPDAAFPPTGLLNVIGSHDLDHFKRIGIDFFLEITSRLRIRRDAAVLDLGCGCGRMAIPFVRYLAGGRYLGCDAWADGIAWCRDHLMDDGIARFEVCDTANNYYFEPRDPAHPNRVALPWLADASLDVAFAVSVFTHLVAQDALGYLREIRRGLKADGLVFATFFLIDDHVWRHVERTGEHRALRETEPGCYYAYGGQDFFAGYTLPTLSGMFAAAGLRVISLDLGSWAEKPGSRCYQDTFILAAA